MVDVCLILEGTWPYVSGGVATWVDQLIRGLPHLSFGIVHIGASPAHTQECKYARPEQVKWIEVLHLHAPVLEVEKESPAASPELQQLQQDMSKWEDPLWTERFGALFPSNQAWPGIEEAFYSESTFEEILELYQRKAPDQSFLDFLWTWRFTALPLWRLCRYAIPEAKVYHTISTGYAGFLAAIARIRHNRPMLITEHGIYTREREIEIQGADWIYGTKDPYASEERKDFFRHWWMDLFFFLNRICYKHADGIYTLYEANRALQIQLGADKDKTLVIPNGVVPERFKATRERFLNKTNTPPTLVFAGRIVPIKDLHTLLRAFALVRESIPQARLILLGPTDEDPEYSRECKELAHHLELDDTVEWAGMVRLEEHLDRGDVLVLSSISEAQPLVLLEAACVGLACVSTRVGSCHELLQGRSPEDQALGLSGLLVPVGNPRALASALTELLLDRNRALEMGKIGYERVQRYYRQDDLMAKYYSLYLEKMQVRTWQE